MQYQSEDFRSKSYEFPKQRQMHWQSTATMDITPHMWCDGRVMGISTAFHFRSFNGAFFFTSEVTSLEELIYPLSGIRINYEQFSRSSGD